MFLVRPTGNRCLSAPMNLSVAMNRVASPLHRFSGPDEAPPRNRGAHDSRGKQGVPAAHVASETTRCVRPARGFPPAGDRLGAREPAPGAEVLDVGTGTGALAIAAARRGAARVTAVDASVRAVLTTRLNALLAGCRVRALSGDLLEPVAGERFHLVLANPPYVPTPHPGFPRHSLDRAWEAGPDGRAVLDRLCAQVPRCSCPAACSCSSSRPSAPPPHDRTAHPVRPRRRHRRPPADPLRAGPARPRAGWLRERGLLEPGQDKEELVVIRARRP
ncbi:methyltransferase [Streptomyces stramineus]